MEARRIHETQRPCYTPEEERMARQAAVSSAQVALRRQLLRLYRAGDRATLQAVCHAASIQIYRLESEAQRLRAANRAKARDKARTQAARTEILVPGWLREA